MMFYDKTEMLSHNCIFNMVISNRGGGKTYSMTRWAIDDFIRKNAMTMWVRRYQTEIDDVVKNCKFFDAVRDKYPGVVFEIKDGVGYINSKPAIYFVALSTSRKLKSNNYPYVNKIIFDEFLINTGASNYLRAEVETFLDLFETVDRMRDCTRAVLLANAISVANPYFSFFNIQPRAKRFTRRGEVLIELFTDSEFIEAKQKTRFGKLVSGTEYAAYAINNEFREDDAAFIEKKTGDAEFLLGVKYQGKIIGFWIDYNACKVFANTQYDPDSNHLYSILTEDNAPNLLMIKRASESYAMQRLIYAYKNGLIRYSDQVVKHACYAFLPLL